MKEAKSPTPEEDEERMTEMMKKDIKPSGEFDEFMGIVERIIKKKVKEEERSL